MIEMIELKQNNWKQSSMQKTYDEERKLIRNEKRRIWNMNYRKWSEADPNFDMKYELCYSFIYQGIPSGWHLQKKRRKYR